MIQAKGAGRTVFGVPGRRELLLLWAVGLGGLVLSVVFFFGYAPGAHIAAPVDRDQARGVAVAFLEQLGISGVEDMTTVETMSTQAAHFLYLDDRYDDWEQIEAAIYKGRSFPRVAAQQQLRRRAERL